MRFLWVCLSFGGLKLDGYLSSPTEQKRPFGQMSDFLNGCTAKDTLWCGILKRLSIHFLLLLDKVREDFILPRGMVNVVVVNLRCF